MNITETDNYIYIPEDYYGDGAPGYRVNKEIASHQEADALKIFPYYQCVMMIGMLRVEKITESMNKDVLLALSKEAFLSNKEQVDTFKKTLEDLAKKMTSIQNQGA